MKNNPQVYIINIDMDMFYDLLHYSENFRHRERYQGSIFMTRNHLFINST